MKSFVSLLIALLASHALAGPVEDALLARASKPTAGEFLAAYGGRIPDQNPFADTRVRNDRVKAMGQASTIIAQLEWLYPGARYVFLGRDATHLSDMFETFYASLGQRDRVVRVEGSTPTFEKATDDQIAEWLTQVGARPRNANDRVILLDATSWSSKDGKLSQVRRLLNVIYSNFLNDMSFPISPGEDAREVLQRGKLSVANAVSFVRLDTHGRPLGPVVAAPKSVPKGDIPGWILNPASWAGAVEPRAIYYVNGALAYNRALYQASARQQAQWVEYEWHKRYEELRQDASGRWSARPGERSSDFIRRAVLSYMWETIRFSASENMRQSTLAAAKALGYDLEATQIARDILRQKLIEPGTQDVATIENFLGKLAAITTVLPAAQQRDVAIELVKDLPRLEALSQRGTDVRELRQTMMSMLLAIEVGQPAIASVGKFSQLIKDSVRAELEAIAQRGKLTLKDLLREGLNDEAWRALDERARRSNLARPSAQWLASELIQLVRDQGLGLPELTRITKASEDSSIGEFLRSVPVPDVLLRELIRQTELKSWDDADSLRSLVARLAPTSRSITDIEQTAEEKIIDSLGRFEPDVQRLNKMIAGTQGQGRRERIYAAAFQNLKTGAQYSRLAKPAAGEQSEVYQILDLRFRQSRNLWFSREDYERRVGPLPRSCGSVFLPEGAAL